MKGGETMEKQLKGDNGATNEVSEFFRFNERKKIQGFQELFSIKDPKEAQEALLEWVKGYSDTELARKWKVPYSRIKRARQLLGLTKDRGGNITLEEDITWLPKPTAASLKALVLKDSRVVTSQEKKERLLSGLNMSLEGLYSPQEVINWLEAIQTMFTGLNETDRFYVTVRLEER